MRPQSVGLLTLAVLLATIGFGIGAAMERATPTATSLEASAGEAAGSSEVGGESPAAAGETAFGINPESVPLIAAAVIASLSLAGGIWLYWRRSAVLWIAAGLMFAFGALDVIEVLHQLAVKHPTLVAVAAVVAALHLLAASLAIRLVSGRAVPAAAIA